MNKTTGFLFIVIIALSFILGTSIQSKADNKGYAGVVPFMSSSDRLGLLDQSNGRIYMYDSSFSKCVFVGQLQGLGQTIQVISQSQ